jgi:hypothetical protein
MYRLWHISFILLERLGKTPKISVRIDSVTATVRTSKLANRRQKRYHLSLISRHVYNCNSSICFVLCGFGTTVLARTSSSSLLCYAMLFPNRDHLILLRYLLRILANMYGNHSCASIAAEFSDEFRILVHIFLIIE